MGFIGFSFDLAAISFKAQFISCHIGWVRGVTFKNCHFVKLTTLMSAAIFTVYENESRLQALSSRERKVELHWDICARQYQLWEGTVHCPHPCNWQLVWLPHETVPVTLHRFTMCSHNVQHNTRLSCFYWLQKYKYKIQIYKPKYTLQIHTMFNTAWCLFASYLLLLTFSFLLSGR